MKIEYGGYVRCSKNSLTAINGKVQCSRIAVSPGSHSLVEFDYHAPIEELAWSHKGFQGAPWIIESQGGRRRPECHKSVHCVGPFYGSNNYMRLGHSKKGAFCLWIPESGLENCQ